MESCASQIKHCEICFLTEIEFQTRVFCIQTDASKTKVLEMEEQVFGYRNGCKKKKQPPKV